MRDHAFQGRSYFTAANHKFPFTLIGLGFPGGIPGLSPLSSVKCV